MLQLKILESQNKNGSPKKDERGGKAGSSQGVAFQSMVGGAPSVMQGQGQGTARSQRLSLKVD